MKTNKFFQFIIILGVTIIVLLFFTLKKSRQTLNHANPPQEISTINNPQKDQFEPISLIPNSQQNNLYYIDQHTGFINQINQGEISPISQIPTDDINYNPPYVTFTDYFNQSRVFVFDEVSSKIFEYNLESLSPIISASTNVTNKEIFLLGNYDYKNRVSSIYKIENNNPVLIHTKTTNTTVDVINNEQLFLTRPMDVANISVFEVYNLKQQQFVYSYTGSYGSLNFDKTLIAIQNKNDLIISNLTFPTNTTIHLPQETAWYWHNNSTIGVVTQPPNATISFINLNHPSPQPDTPRNIQVNSSFKRIIGAINNYLYTLNMDSKIEKIQIN